MTDPKALEELDLASRAIERARALLAGEGPVPLMDVTAVLVALAEERIPPDVLGLLTEGHPSRGIRPGSLWRALKPSPSPAVRDAPWTGACRHCPANFRTRAELEEHERSHTAVRDVTLRGALEKVDQYLSERMGPPAFATHGKNIRAIIHSALNIRAQDPQEMEDPKSYIGSSRGNLEPFLSPLSPPEGGKP